MHTIRQILTVTRLSLSTLPQRYRGALVIVTGIGLMVVVLLFFLAIREGMKAGLLEAGDPARVMIYRPHPGNRTAWPESLLSALAAAPGVARAGASLVNAQTRFGIDDLLKRNNGNNNGYTSIVGVGPHWRDLSSSFRLLSGRMPRPGTRELLAGETALRKFSDLDDGFVTWEGLRWRIVGIFRNGGIEDTQLVGDARVIRAATKEKGNHFVLVRLVSPEAFEEFYAAVRVKLPPDAVMIRETEFFAQEWRDLDGSVPAFYAAYVLTALIGLGMIAGTMQTMQGAMEERTREIAILRAIGFDGIAVAASAVLEAMLLAMTGACLGTAGIGLLWGNFLVNADGGVITVTVNLNLLMIGNVLGLIVALIGTLALAVKAARQTPIEALRAV